MTCFEKYKLEHGGEEPDVKNRCPNISGGIDIPEPSYCAFGRTDECARCWNREIPGTESIPVIKDSGERREFDTGAVRDIQEGKGRCDLMPLEVVSKMLAPDMDLSGSDLVIGNVALFKNKNFNTFYLYQALYYFAEKYYDGFLPTMFLEVAKHFEDGAKKYGENNWQKGLPINCYIDSAVRHYIKWLRGDTDEPHDRAFVWNLMCCIWTCDFKYELNNHEEEN